ncbi:MAG: hypothetical protein IJN62_04350 [Clostridia bacterium]|nr:hypothetical protein [Clostridia bacterium]
MKKVLSILLVAVMLLGTVNFTVSAEATSLPAAQDGIITLTEDVRLPQDTRFNDAMTINLNGNTLYITNCVTFNADTTISNGTINADNQTSADGIIRADYHHGSSVELELNNVTVSALNANYATGVFYLHTADDTLILDNVDITVSGANDDPGSGVFYSPSSFDRGSVVLTNGTTLTTNRTNAIFFAAEVDIADSTIVCTDVKRPVFRQANGEVENSTITVNSIENGRAVIADVSGQNSGVITFINSDVLVPDGTTMTDFSNEGSSVVADSKSNVGDGEGITSAVATINGFPYATLETALTAAQDGDTIKLASGTYAPINLSGKSITLEGTVGENGELLSEIKGGNIGLTLHNFNGTIKNLKITDSFRAAYGEPAGNITFDNVCVTGATYGFHLIAYQDNITWNIQNCYMDISWANSLSNYNCGHPTINIKNNVFESTSPYYPDYGAPIVNTFSPNTTVENNAFGENTKIYVRTEEAAAGVTIGTNYYAEGAENAFIDDEDSYLVSIPSCYETADMETVIDAPVINGEFTGFSIADALAVATDGDIITVAPGTYNAFNAGVYASPLNNITIKAADPANKPVINVSEVNDGGIEYQGSNITFENLKFVVTEDCAAATTWNVSVLGYYYENVGISREGLTVKGCEFINNSDIEMSAIAANLSTYTVENCTFTNFLTGVHSYMDNSVVENVYINNNNYSNVDILVSVYYGGAATGTSTLTVTNNKSLDESVTKLSVDDYAKVNNTTTKAYDILNVNNNDANVIVHNYKDGEYSTDLNNNTNVVYNYASKDIALACAETGDEFYFNYGRNTQTKAKKTADGIIYTEISGNSEKAVFLDGVYYNTIAEATASAANNDIIVLLTDGIVLEDADAAILAGKSVTIDLNGKELTINSAADYSDLISIPKNYKLNRTVVADSVYTYSLKKVSVASPVGVVGGGGSSVSKPSTPSQDKTDEETKNNDENKENSTTPNTEKTTNNIVLTIGDTNINLFGNTIKNDVAPKLVNDRTMLPARIIAESLGATVTWTAAEPNKVLIEKGETVIIITIGSDIATVNDEEIKLDSPAFIENDRTYIPTRFLSEKLGATVEWIGETSQVIITKTE